MPPLSPDLGLGAPFRHGGDVASRLAAIDWSESSLGPVASWPASLRTLVDLLLGSKQPMFVAWGDEKTLIYNDAYAEILAAKHPSALARPFLEVWSEIREELEPIVAQAFAGDPVHMDDITLVMHRRGFPEETHFAFSYTPVFGDDDTVLGFFCVCTEITAQVLSERRLAEETARQRRLFEQAPGFIVILRSPAHTFEFVNAAYRRLFGDRDYIGRDARDLFPELEGQEFFDLLDRVWSTGERIVARDVTARVDDGRGGVRELHLDFIYEPVLDERGQVTGIFCEGHDVTETYRAQLALKSSEERFRTALQIQTVGAIYFDMEGRLTDANDAFLRMAGYSRAELEAGRLTWQAMTPPEWIADSERAFAELKARGETTPYEKEYLRKDGSRWWALFAAKLLPDGTGFEFVLDITDRKRAEAHLQLVAMELNHRVKNNLATVQSIVRQALRRDADPLQAREALLDRISALAAAHDILTREQWEGAPLDELARGVLTPLAGDHRLTLEGPRAVLSPKTAISVSMAFHELGTNALKYGALSAPGGRVSISWTRAPTAADAVLLTWRESDGPPVQPPRREGFGSRLLKSGLSAELGGPVEIRYAPDGVQATLHIPVEDGGRSR
ncbi:PAS domain-containing protein [Phenylobacterium sp.]|uniref:PAS domain-containing sensor histidine kinase n=1 Tax=Phenylobacterium sp. TaxID=1871053 RepID=UPI0028113A82|nr:PAS domain-containing protein [Phenylobacterium sp.]